MADAAVTMARVLVAQYRASEAAQRPIDRKITLAAFRAGCAVAHAAGYGMTPDHVVGVVIDVVRSAGDPPGFRAAGSNDALREFNAQVAGVVGEALAGIA